MNKQSKSHFVKLSQDIGTPSHIDFLKSNDDRRHKARCIYYSKQDKNCHCGKCCTYMLKCIGSSHCYNYDDNPTHLE